MVVLCIVAYFHYSFNTEKSQPISKLVEKEEVIGKDLFVSQIQEPWNHFTKEYYNDFLDQGSLQSSNFDSDTSFTAQVIRLYERNDIDPVIKKLDRYSNLEAVSFVKCEFSRNQLEAFFETIEKKIHFKKLAISHSNLKALPDNFYNLNNLMTLDLSDNKLGEIKPAIGEFKKLQVLDLRGNRKLRKLPKNLGSLENLELLNISACSIDSIPNSIGDCLKLRNLTANAGKLKHVPNSIGNCQNLKNINLGYNLIENLPNGIGKIKGLGLLSVGHNPYDSIPVSYKNLTKLFHFN